MMNCLYHLIAAGTGKTGRRTFWSKLSGSGVKSQDRCGRQKSRMCIIRGNIDVSFIHKVVEKGLVTRGRNMKFKTPMLDVPGSLEKMARILHEVNANIIEVRYDRIQADLGLNETIIHIGVEVSSKEHGAKMLEKLKENGYDITVE